MSLTVAMNAATSSLRTVQLQLSVASNNIANADTDGYTVKSATQSSVVTGGVGSGVSVSGVVSDADPYLLRDIVAAVSEDAEAATLSDVLGRLGEAFGVVSGDDESTGTSLSGLLSDVESALDELASTPESETLKTQVVNTLDDAAAALREASATVQELRTDADVAISDSIATINDALTGIDDLNEDIRLAKLSGQSTAGLEDQRMTQLQTLAAEIDVAYFIDDTGTMRVYTGSGQTLVDSRAHLLEHDSVATASATTTFDAITVNGKDITASLRSGTLAALVTLRDETLPTVQGSLDSLATDLRDTLNTTAGSTLLDGTSAADLSVSDTLRDDPSTLPVATMSEASALADALRAADATGQAGDLLSEIGLRIDHADAQSTSKETTLSTLTSRFSSAYGVNLDEESARITELENAYAAASQVISAIQSMFDALLEAVK